LLAVFTDMELSVDHVVQVEVQILAILELVDGQRGRSGWLPAIGLAIGGRRGSATSPHEEVEIITGIGHDGLGDPVLERVVAGLRAGAVREVEVQRTLVGVGLEELARVAVPDLELIEGDRAAAGAQRGHGRLRAGEPARGELEHEHGQRYESRHRLLLSAKGGPPISTGNCSYHAGMTASTNRRSPANLARPGGAGCQRDARRASSRAARISRASAAARCSAAGSSRRPHSAA